MVKLWPHQLKMAAELGRRSDEAIQLRNILSMLNVIRRFGQHSTVATNARENIRSAKRRLKAVRKLRGGT